ncbi:hypothetical protein [Aquimarina algiphila]|uniref:hypothetical protein n=1 Tax=Aquimarina algiphila TaxID=2047982 RepID=UPI00232AF74A|nr:hypothetical protein [Aquimarina algiphila]
MRKLLLFTCIISFLTVGSCSRDEEPTEVSLTEKEYLVKQTIIEFNNSAIKTGKYKGFVNSVAQKSAVEELNSGELEVLLEEFLGEQTQAFLDVYYQLVALNITPEEFYNIASQFEYLRLNITLNRDKGSGGCCSAGGDGNIFVALYNWVCGCEQA